MSKRALITGITGQDASYLSEQLVSLGYEVHGTTRRISSENNRYWRLPDISKIRLHQMTLESEPSIMKVIREVRPDECYHLAAQSDVPNSFLDEFTSMNVNAFGTHMLLAGLKEYAPECRFYFAGSSEMFGGIDSMSQDEDTPFHPRSSYAVSKVAGFDLTRYYREAFNMFACSGILFNHESPRRGEAFVTRKIAIGVAAIARKKQTYLSLGNMAAYRDWGFAPEYTNAMRMILNFSRPDDFVIATNTTYTVREFVQTAFECAGINDWESHVRFDENLKRQCEVPLLKGNYSKAKAALGWEPKVHFRELVQIMVEAELAKAS